MSATRTMVRSQAGLVAHAIGCRVAAVHEGNRTNGVSWHVTFYRDSVTGSPVTTVRLGTTASESFDVLSAMLEGAELVRMTSLEPIRRIVSEVGAPPQAEDYVTAGGWNNTADSETDWAKYDEASSDHGEHASAAIEAIRGLLGKDT